MAIRLRRCSDSERVSTDFKENLKTTNGINRRSKLTVSKLQYNQTDMMHGILEGVAQYEINLDRFNSEDI